MLLLDTHAAEGTTNGLLCKDSEVLRTTSLKSLVPQSIPDSF